MKILLFFNFHFGDVYGVASSTWDWFKTFLPVFIAVGAILFQRWFDAKKEQKKQILKLYNFNQHIKYILSKSEAHIANFNDFALKSTVDPLDDIHLGQHILIPDFKRMLDINKDDIFSAFILKYKDNKQAANDYSDAYNYIEFYKQTNEEMYNRYDALIEEIFINKQKLSEMIFEVDISSVELIFDVKRSNPNFKDAAIFKELTALRNGYIIKEKESGKSSYQFKFDSLIHPLDQALLKYSELPKVIELRRLISKTINQRNNIVHDVTQLGSFVGENTKFIAKCVEKMKVLSITLDKKLTEFDGKQNKLRYSIRNWFDI